MTGKMWMSVAVGVVVVLAVSTRSPAPAQGQGDGGESEIQRGFQIAPVPLNLHGKNRGLVGLGSYLVNGQSVCFACHSVDDFLPGGNPFLGQPAIVNPATYMGGGEAFGPFVSRNLTPDANGRPAGLTLDEFKLVMRTGIDLKGIPPAPLLQVMPWPEYRHMTDRFLDAIYEYLSAIPCLEGGPGAPPNRCGP
jgi:hypothetical protein